MGTGCASMNRKAKLEEAVTGYARALQDGDPYGLLGFVGTKSQEDFIKNSKSLKALHFSNVEVKKVYPNEKLNSAQVVIQMEFFNQLESSLMSTQRRFAWTFDEKKGHWFLDQPMPLGIQ